jgi:C4-dicarboxylate-specific signal transduction histidine kinase
MNDARGEVQRLVVCILHVMLYIVRLDRSPKAANEDGTILKPHRDRRRATASSRVHIPTHQLAHAQHPRVRARHHAVESHIHTIVHACASRLRASRTMSRRLVARRRRRHLRVLDSEPNATTTGAREEPERSTPPPMPVHTDAACSGGMTRVHRSHASHL